MRKNHGVTIVEILVSIIIISIIMILLFSLLSQVKEDDDENKINSSNLITQATILKELEEDIASYGVNSISDCSINDKNPTLYSLVRDTRSRCIKITYAGDYMKDNIAFLTVSKTYDEYDASGGSYVGRGDGSWKVEYSRGFYQDYSGTNPVISSWINTKSISKKVEGDLILTTNEADPYVTYTTDLDINAATIVMPIVTADGLHFDINAGFTYSKENKIVCTPGGNLTCSKDTSTDYFRIIMNVGSNGRAYVNTELVKWGSDAIITIIPDKRYQLSTISCTNGWRLGSFTKDKNPQQVRITNTHTSEPTTCTVTFERHPYDVTLDATGGSVSPNKVTVLYGNKYGSLPTPTKSGYTFYNWYLNGTVINANTTVTQEDPHTLKAKWWYSSTHQIDYYCDTGDALSSTTCTHSISATNSSYYTCPDGYTLSGSKCYYTYTGTDVTTPGCASGWSLSGSSCVQGGSPYADPWCDSGYDLNSTKTACRKAVGTPGYNCNHLSSYLQSGTTCYYCNSGYLSGYYTCCGIGGNSSVCGSSSSTSAQYGCTSGSQDGSTCYAYGTFHDRTSYTCPNGGTVSGSDCVTTTIPVHVRWDCNSGDTGGGASSTCTHTIDATFHLYYTCPTGYYGGNLSSICSRDYTAYKNEYETCPKGGTLFDTTKCLVESV